MNKKMQWFKWYPKDFIDDEEVKAMDYDAIGLYMIMLGHCWTNDSMPSDLKKLAKIFNLTNHRFNKLWDQVSVKFFEKDERFFNKRILSEKTKLEKDFKEKSRIGKENIDKRWKKNTIGNTNGITSVIQDPDPDKEVDIKPSKPLDTQTTKTGPKNISNRTGFDIANAIKAHQQALDPSNGDDTPIMKKLVFAILKVREQPHDEERLLAYLLQGRRAKGIKDRIAFTIKIVKDPKYAVADGCLEDAKKIIRKWNDEDIDPRVKDLLK